MEDYAVIKLRELIIVEMDKRKPEIDSKNHARKKARKMYYVLSAIWIALGLFMGIIPFLLPAVVLFYIGRFKGRDVRSSIMTKSVQWAMFKNNDMLISEIVAQQTDLALNGRKNPDKSPVWSKFKRGLILTVLLVSSTGILSLIAKEVAATPEDKFPVHHEEHIFKEYKDGMRLVACGTNYDQDEMVVIPSEYEGKPVREIGKYAFAGMNMAGVTIPDSVEVIDSAAFYRCQKLKEVIFGKNVSKINGEAFMYCTSLKSIRIPEKVTEIRGNTFEGCSNLQYVAMHDGITSIRAFAFSSCTSLETITLPSGITKISEGTFKDCSKLRSIIIPDGVTRISAHAFRHCSSLSDVYIPDSVKEIGSSAFRGCSRLRQVSISYRTSMKERAFKDSPTRIIRR